MNKYTIESGPLNFKEDVYLSEPPTSETIYEHLKARVPQDQMLSLYSDDAPEENKAVVRDALRNGYFEHDVDFWDTAKTVLKEFGKGSWDAISGKGEKQQDNLFKLLQVSPGSYTKVKKPDNAITKLTGTVNNALGTFNKFTHGPADTSKLEKDFPDDVLARADKMALELVGRARDDEFNVNDTYAELRNQFQVPMDRNLDAIIASKAYKYGSSQNTANLYQAGAEAFVGYKMMGDFGAKAIESPGLLIPSYFQDWRDHSDAQLDTQIKYMQRQAESINAIEGGAQTIAEFVGDIETYNDLAMDRIEPDRAKSMAMSMLLQPDVYVTGGVTASVVRGKDLLRRGSVRVLQEELKKAHQLKTTATLLTADLAKDSLGRITGELGEAKVKSIQTKLGKQIAQADKDILAITEKLATKLRPPKPAGLSQTIVGKTVEKLGASAEWAGRGMEFLKSLPRETAINFLMKNGYATTREGAGLALDTAVKGGSILTLGALGYNENYTTMGSGIALMLGPRFLEQVGRTAKVFGRQSLEMQRTMPYWKSLGASPADNPTYAGSLFDNEAFNYSFLDTYKILNQARQVPRNNVPGLGRFIAKGMEYVPGNSLMNRGIHATVEGLSLPMGIGYATGGEEGMAGGVAIGGPIVGVAGAGGQLMRFKDAGQLKQRQMGDLLAYEKSLSPAQLKGFRRLLPEEKTAIAEASTYFPDMQLKFINDDKATPGMQYVDTEGNGVVQINMAKVRKEGGSVLGQILAHEIGHHVKSHGLHYNVREILFGDVRKNRPGWFTERDDKQKPIIVKDKYGHNQYKTNAHFQAIKDEYVAKLKKSNVDPGTLRNYQDIPEMIGDEYFAEMMAHRILTGKTRKTAMSGPYANKMASIVDGALVNLGDKLLSTKFFRQANHSIGNAVTIDGSKMIFTNKSKDSLRFNKEVDRLIGEYERRTIGKSSGVIKKNEGDLSMLQDTNPNDFEVGPKDYGNLDAIEHFNNGGIFKTNPDGTLATDAFGKVQLKMPKEQNAENAQLANDVITLIQKYSDSAEDGHITLYETKDGSLRGSGRFLDERIINELTDSFNPVQLDILRRASRSGMRQQPGIFNNESINPEYIYDTFGNRTKNPNYNPDMAGQDFDGPPGNRFLMMYYKAMGGGRLGASGRKYKTVKGEMRDTLVYGITVTKDKNIIVDTFSQEQITKNVQHLLSTKGRLENAKNAFQIDNPVELAKRIQNDLIEFTKEHKNNILTGSKESKFTPEQKQILNASFGALNKRQIELNPLLAGLGEKKSQRMAVTRSRRLDRIASMDEFGEGMHTDPRAIQNYQMPMPKQNIPDNTRMMPDPGDGTKYFHGGPKDSIDSIRAKGLDRMKSEKGYFGRGFYMTPDETIARDTYGDFQMEEGQAGDFLSGTLKEGANIVDFTKPDGTNAKNDALQKKYMDLVNGPRRRGSRPSDDDHDLFMVKNGIDGVIDNSVGGPGGLVVYNPEVLKFDGPENAMMMPDAEGLDGIINRELAKEKTSQSPDYRGVHKAPGFDPEASGNTLDNLNGSFPDIYGPNGLRYYGVDIDNPRVDQEAISVIKKAQNDPEGEVMVYRAVPEFVDEINPGDWVAITEEYARDHGDRYIQGQTRVLSKSIKAKELYSEGNSIQEFGWDPGTHQEPGAMFMPDPGDNKPLQMAPGPMGLNYYHNDNVILFGPMYEGMAPHRSGKHIPRAKFQIFDMENYKKMNAQGKTVTDSDGYVVASITDEGHFDSLIDIRINKGTQKKGLGTSVVHSMLNHAMDNELRIKDIQGSAKKFWQKIGSEDFKPFLDSGYKTRTEAIMKLEGRQFQSIFPEQNKGMMMPDQTEMDFSSSSTEALFEKVDFDMREKNDGMGDPVLDNLYDKLPEKFEKKQFENMMEKNGLTRYAKHTKIADRLFDNKDKATKRELLDAVSIHGPQISKHPQGEKFKEYFPSSYDGESPRLEYHYEAFSDETWNGEVWDGDHSDVQNVVWHERSERGHTYIRDEDGNIEMSNEYILGELQSDAHQNARKLVDPKKDFDPVTNPKRGYKSEFKIDQKRLEELDNRYQAKEEENVVQLGELNNLVAEKLQEGIDKAYEAMTTDAYYDGSKLPPKPVVHQISPGAKPVIGPADIVNMTPGTKARHPQVGTAVPKWDGNSALFLNHNAYGDTIDRAFMRAMGESSGVTTGYPDAFMPSFHMFRNMDTWFQLKDKFEYIEGNIGVLDRLKQDMQEMVKAGDKSTGIESYKNWVEPGIKRSIHNAVRDGYERYSILMGEDIHKAMKPSEHIDGIEYTTFTDDKGKKRFNIMGYKKQVFGRGMMKGKGLADNEMFNEYFTDTPLGKRFDGSALMLSDILIKTNSGDDVIISPRAGMTQEDRRMAFNKLKEMDPDSFEPLGNLDDFMTGKVNELHGEDVMTKLEKLNKQNLTEDEFAMLIDGRNYKKFVKDGGAKNIGPDKFEIEATGLDTDAQPMRQFYDNELVKRVNKIGKKFGLEPMKLVEANITPAKIVVDARFKVNLIEDAEGMLNETFNTLVKGGLYDESERAKYISTAMRKDSQTTTKETEAYKKIVAQFESQAFKDAGFKLKHKTTGRHDIIRQIEIELPVTKEAHDANDYSSFWETYGNVAGDDTFFSDHHMNVHGEGIRSYLYNQKVHSLPRKSMDLFPAKVGQDPKVRAGWRNTTEGIKHFQKMENELRMFMPDDPDAPLLGVDDNHPLLELLEQSNARHSEAVPVTQAIDKKSGKPKWKEVLDDDDNPILDADGNPKMNPEYEVVDYDLQNSPVVQNYAGKKSSKIEYDIDGMDVVLSGPQKAKVREIMESGALDETANRVEQEITTWMEDPAIKAGDGWYSRMRKKLATALGDDHEIFSQLLGATSARTPVETNFIQAREALTLYKNGSYDNLIKTYMEGYNHFKNGTIAEFMVKKKMATRAETMTPRRKLKNGTVREAKYRNSDQLNRQLLTRYVRGLDHNGKQVRKLLIPLRANGKKYNANSGQVMRVLAGNWLTMSESPKTPNFAGNLTGRTLQATIDVWAGRMLRRKMFEGEKQWRIQPASEGPVGNVDFALGQIVFAEVAKRLGKNPDDLQAIAWFGEKDLYGKNNWTSDDGAFKSSFDEPMDIFFPDGQEPRNLKDGVKIIDYHRADRSMKKWNATIKDPSRFLKKDGTQYTKTEAIDKFNESKKEYNRLGKSIPVQRYLNSKN